MPAEKLLDKFVNKYEDSVPGGPGLKNIHPREMGLTEKYSSKGNGS